MDTMTMHIADSNVKLGAPCKDLASTLGRFFWPNQTVLPSSGQLLLGDRNQYFWKLHCGQCSQHLTYMTVQGAARAYDTLLQTLHAAGIPSSFAYGVGLCDRCQSNYREQGASTSTELHRSHAEQVAWLGMDHVMTTPAVSSWMGTLVGDGIYGADRGYVVEVRVVKGWTGKVDMCVPSIRFIIQVDGNHHKLGKQMWTDSRFNAKAVKAGWRVLRLFHKDEVAFQRYISKAVDKCMLDKSTWVMCTPQHPLLDEAYAVPVIFQA